MIINNIIGFNRVYTCATEASASTQPPAHLLRPALGRAAHEREELVGPRVDAPVGEEADQVERVLGEGAGHVRPPLPQEEGPRGEGLVHERGALVDDLLRVVVGGWGGGWVGEGGFGFGF